MSNLDDALLIELMDLVYAAAMDPSRWANVTSALGVAFRAQFSLMFGFDSSRSRVLYAELWGLPQDALTPYERTYAALDIRMPPALRAPAGTVVTDETLIDRTTLHASPIYNEYLRRIDCDHIMGVLPSNSPDMQVIISLNRSRRTGAFDCQEQAFLQRLVPHIQRAVSMSAQLVTANHATRLSEDLMTRVNFGIITLAVDGRVVDVNPIAERILRDGNTLTQLGGRLMAASRVANDRLQRAIAATLEFRVDRKHNTIEPLMVPSDNGIPLRLLIAPMAVPLSVLHGPHPVAIVFLFAKNAGPKICLETLRLAYGLTPAEAKITARLAEGCSVDEIARTSSLSIETVRTHIKRVFAKTDCNSQALLVREILTGPTSSSASMRNNARN
jgi:DNA-binding CsgD family transcriptional regulator